ncbi:MAG: PAS domain S-box protein [Solirubrobacterales bacterium]
MAISRRIRDIIANTGLVHRVVFAIAALTLIPVLYFSIAIPETYIDRETNRRETYMITVLQTLNLIIKDRDTRQTLAGEVSSHELDPDLVEKIVAQKEWNWPGLLLGVYDRQNRKIAKVYSTWRPELGEVLKHPDAAGLLNSASIEKKIVNASGGGPYVMVAQPLDTLSKQYQLFCILPMKEVYDDALSDVAGVWVTGVAIALFLGLLTWALFILLRKEMMQYAAEMAEEHPGQYPRRLPELEPVLETIRLRATELERERQARLNVQEQLNRFFYLSPDGFIILDSSKRVIMMNENLTNLLGYPPDHFLGVSTWDAVMRYVHPGDQKKAWIAVNRIDSNPKLINFECRARHSDQSYRWISWAAHRAEDRTYVVARDVTEEKILAEELDATSRIVLEILERTPDGFCTLDRAFRFSYVNPAAEPILQRNRSGLIGQSFWDVFPYLQKTGLYTQLHQVMHEGRAVETELLSPATQRIYHYQAYPSSNGLSAHIRDVTDQNRAARQLELLASVVVGSSSAIYSYDRYGKIMTWNHAAEEMYEYTAEEAIGMNIRELWLPEDVMIAELIHQTITNGQVFRDLEGRQMRKDGTAFDVSTSVSPIRDQNHVITAASAVTTDITRRKTAERARMESEALFGRAFQLSPSPIMLLHLDNKQFTQVNDAFVTITGYSAEEVIGITPSELGFFTPEHEERMAKGFRNREFRFFNRFGEERAGLISSEVFEMNGREHVLCIMTDLTDKRRMDAEMARFDRMSLVGQFAASIGHEIRNPMTTVRGFLQMLLRKAAYQTEHEYFELMIEELDRANAIITEFLSLARDKVVTRTPQKLNQIIEAIAPLMMAEAVLENKQIELCLQPLPEVEADPKEIRQLVLNLVRNGLDAMEQDRRLWIRTKIENQIAILEVADEGAGIPGDIIDKIGTPFFTTKEGGTGLGLAVCYSIAERHNARLHFQTSATGTVFSVCFPSDPAAKSVSEPAGGRSTSADEKYDQPPMRITRIG